MSAPLVITDVYRFRNGMTMTFDQHGEQMPEYQGRDGWEKAKSDAPPTATFSDDVVWHPPSP